MRDPARDPLPADPLLAEQIRLGYRIFLDTPREAPRFADHAEREIQPDDAAAPWRHGEGGEPGAGGEVEGQRLRERRREAHHLGQPGGMAVDRARRVRRRLPAELGLHRPLGVLAHRRGRAGAASTRPNFTVVTPP